MAKKGSKFKSYTPEFKIAVVKDDLSGEYGGAAKIARERGVSSKTQILVWSRLYKEKGEAVFYTKQDYVNNLKSRRKTVSKATYNNMSDKEKVEYLEMENTMLKKLKAIQNPKTK